MADSVTNMPQMSSSQASKEVTFNETVDSLSPAALFGRNADATSALTWGYLGGKYRKGDGTILEVVNGTVALTASATNYIKETDGVVSVTTAPPSGWPSPLSGGAKALYAVKCNATGVDPADWPAGGYKDYRTTGIGSGNSAGSSAASGVSIADAGGYYASTDVEGALQEVGAAAIAAKPYEPIVSYSSAPTANKILLKFTCTRALTLAANMAGSKSTAADVAATASTVISVKKNGTQVATITYASAGTTPTLATTGGTPVSFAADDVFSVVAPASPDSTLSGIYIVFAMTR